MKKSDHSKQEMAIPSESPLPGYQVDRDRWNSLSFFAQMGNIGSEVGRALARKRRGMDFEPAMIRALDLFNATLEPLIREKSHRSREIIRARDQFMLALFEKDDPGIETYFTQFAMAERNRENSGS